MIQSSKTNCLQKQTVLRVATAEKISTTGGQSEAENGGQSERKWGGQSGVKNGDQSNAKSSGQFVRNLQSSQDFLTEFEFNQQVIKDKLIDLEDAYVNGQSVSTIISELQALQNSLVELNSEVDIEIENSSVEKLSGTENLEMMNNELVAVSGIESNERQVNEVYFATIGKEIYDFNTSQLEILKNISYQCPLAGGNAVFKARALYSLAGGQNYYNDRAICNQAGIELRMNVEKQNSKLKIYPNPANERLIIEYMIENSSSGVFKLYNSSGQLIYERKISGNSNLLEINTTNLKQGLYQFSFMVKDSIIENGKIAIIH